MLYKADKLAVGGFFLRGLSQAWGRGNAMPNMRPKRYNLLPIGRAVNIVHTTELEETIADLAKRYEDYLDAIKRPAQGVLQLVFKSIEGAEEAITHGIKCCGYTLDAKMSETRKPIWVTTTGLPMEESYGKSINMILSRYGVIAKETRKKMWRGTRLWTTEWETLIFMKGDLPSHCDFGECRAYFRYKGMEQKCFVCGSTSHKISDCHWKKTGEDSIYFNGVLGQNWDKNTKSEEEKVSENAEEDTNCHTNVNEKHNAQKQDNFQNEIDKEISNADSRSWDEQVLAESYE
jgi:hypothetical protein